MAVIPQPVPTGYTIGACTEYTPVSELFTFNIEPICSRQGPNTQKQLMYQNRYGHYDYYTFTAGKSEAVGIDRQTLQSWNVDWGGPNPSWAPYSFGVEDFQLTITETHVINTGFLNQPDFMYLEDLWTSREVYEIKDDGTITPIIVTNTEFLKKNKGNKTIVNLELTYVYSNNITIISK